ncbi:hypothetical protein ACIGAN_34710 [Streptomyces sp. NPDC085931]|uniref:hypothetical protein n=1 Tax=Streptomyces sp. NPDC085931 TaxID=3365740 RepID=UPI0037D8C1E9
MHRTTTTATLLVTVAVSALAGCTTVQQPVAPGPSAAPSRPPLPGERTEPQIVQAPAREALQLIEEASRRPMPAAPGSGPSTARAAAPPAEAPERQRPPSGRHEARTRPVRPDRPEPPRRSPQRPRADRPGVPEPVRQGVGGQVPGGTDVCALGRRYGGWRADSPEATICRDTYGR